VERLARAGRAAQARLARLPSEAREAALKLAAQALRRAEPEILAANAIDMANGEARGLTGAARPLAARPRVWPRWPMPWRKLPASKTLSARSSTAAAAPTGMVLAACACPSG
jgi:acyl-CoA reductase-like NAD-dependent aldehyde dehydrogenase